MRKQKESMAVEGKRKNNDNEIIKKIEDLELINSVNIALNEDKSLQEIINIISKGTKKLFYGSGIAVYLMSNDGKYLYLQNLNVTPAQRKKIEHLIRIKIPKIRIPLKESSYYYKILKEKNPIITNDNDEIKKIITEFANVIPDNRVLLKKAIIKLVPKIQEILKIKSVMVFPLISGETSIGLIDISGRKEFTDFDLERMKIILEQLVSVIERKKLDTGLKEARNEVEQIFNSSIVGLRIISKDFDILKINKAFADLFGLKEEEVVGRKCFEVIRLPECNTKNCILKRILNGEKSVTGVFERENNNSKSFYSLSATPIINQEGHTVGIVESFRDFTLEKQSYEKVRLSEEKFRDLFDNMSSGVAVYEAKNDGSDFIIRDFNKSAERIENIKREDVIGKGVLEAFPSVKEIGLYDVFKRVYKTGKPEKHPITFYKDNRISGWRRNYVYKLPSGEVVSVYDDLTREKQAELLLKDSEEFSSSLMENSPNPIMVVNPDTSIRYVNKALENQVGIKSDLLIGMTPPYPWWPEDDKEELFNNFREALKKDLSKSECIFINAAGERFWVEINTKRVLSDDGKLKYLIANFFNLTERKVMEKKLKISYEQVRKTLDGTINTLAMIVETRDPYTSGHQKSVSRLAVAIAKELGLSDEKIEIIETTAKIHDIGKINIPSSILTKPGKLTEMEFNLIKTHARVGYDIVKQIDFPMPIADIILQHHEKLDGSGYPQGLKEKDIMIEAKILTVSDVVEAMTSFRPYRPALGLDVAIDEIKKNKGKLYDPDVVDACIRVVTRKGFKLD